MHLRDYNPTDGNNTATPPDGAPENGTRVSDFNEIVRAMMGAVSRFARDTDGTLVTGGTADEYTLNTHSTFTAFSRHFLTFRAHTTCNTNANIVVDSLPVQALFKGNGAKLSAGDIVADGIYCIAYNPGQGFQVLGISEHGTLEGGALHAIATAAAAGFMSAADKAKLDGIAAGADQSPSAPVLKTLYESNANTNAYTDADRTKLAGLTPGVGGGFTTGAEVLGALLGVDGAGSGLDADTFRGNVPSAFVFALNGLAALNALNQGDQFLVYRAGLGHRTVALADLNPVVRVLTGSRALVAADANALLDWNSPAGITLTLDASLNGLADGVQIVIASGQAAITMASTVTLNSANGLRVIQPGGMGVLVKLANGRWNLAGNLQ